MTIWEPFYVKYECGHKNRPDRSPVIGIKIALEGPIECKKCQKSIDAREDLRTSDRPLVKVVLESLKKDAPLA